MPIDSAVPIIQDLIDNGYVTGRPQIGFSGENIGQLVSNYYGIPMGICVRFLENDSGAAKGGIKVGDIIVGINGKTITTMSELNEVKDTFKPGNSVTLKVYRDGTTQDITVILGESKS
ncbi:MAG: PDZ domain-containing protein [Oscillospiraceae bacterium]